MDTSTPTHIINDALEITVFPDTYWVQTASGWFLCRSGGPDMSPQILAVMVRHTGGGGEFSYVVLDRAGLFMRHEKTIGFHRYFIVEPREPRLIHLRYRQSRVLGQVGLDATKGIIVSKLQNSEHIVVSNCNTVLPRKTFEDPEPEDTRIDMEDLEGDWSLL